MFCDARSPPNGHLRRFRTLPSWTRSFSASIRLLTLGPRLVLSSFESSDAIASTFDPLRPWSTSRRVQFVGYYFYLNIPRKITGIRINASFNNEMKEYHERKMYGRRLILVPTRASLALAHSARSDTLPEPYSFRASYVPSPRIIRSRVLPTPCRRRDKYIDTKKTKS